MEDLMKASSAYTVKKWEETTYNEISPEMRLTKASVEFEMSGDLNGKAMVEYIMFYKHFDESDQHKSNAVYTGLMRFQGNVNGKSGSFVIEEHGTYERGTSNSSLQILNGSGTEELKDIQGAGRYITNPDGFRIELEYRL